MKRTITNIILSLSGLLFPFLMNAENLTLDGIWKFKSDVEETWHVGTVPGCVHLDLMKDGTIPDPYFGDNEKYLQWIGEKSWIYKRSFNVDESLLAHEHQLLILEGIDTYAEVAVNGHKVLSCDNMFRTWTADVKGLLVKGENEIVVSFESVFHHDIPKYLSSPYKLQAWPNNDQGDIWLSLYARKAGYNYGWDWGPRLITTGIWKSAGIRAWSGLRINPSKIVTESIEMGGSSDMSKAKSARLLVDVEIESDLASDASIQITMNGKLIHTQPCRVEVGLNLIPCRFKVKNPELWWSNGLGSPVLNEFCIKVTAGKKEAERTEVAGIRTIQVKRESDAWGTSMAVCLNGRDVFCKGANYIPSDNFPSRLTAEDYDRIVSYARDANMNMLRVWGGGFYEDDMFYSACDRMGILVWQDMAFACGMFPGYDEQYCRNVEQEIKDNVIRLRNHPSLALWCGNNENEMSYFGGGWNRTINGVHKDEFEKGSHYLFYNLIPSIVNKYDGTRYYHPTSPVAGYGKTDYDNGDAHFWSVWKGGWVEEYLEEKNIARFMSEYGFQSYPCIETIRSYTDMKDRRIGSAVMLSHQKAHDDNSGDPNFGDKMMKMYLQKYLTVPEDFSDIIYLSQFEQAEAVDVAINAHRRAMPYCMGTLFWQINDCWPVASWSSVDWYGRWKALQFYARRSYEQVLLSPYSKGNGDIVLKVISDLPDDFSAEVRVRCLDFSGRCHHSDSLFMKIAAGTAADALVIPGKVFGSIPHDVVVVSEILENGKKLAEDVWFPDFPNTYRYSDIDPVVTFDSLADGQSLLTLSSDKLIRGVHISLADGSYLELSDDWFTILPGEVKTVLVKDSPELHSVDDLMIQSINKILKGDETALVSYVTEPDGQSLIQEMDNVTFKDTPSGRTVPIIVDPSQKFQTMEGFGFALTGGSAQMMMAMSADARRSLIEELFGKSEGQAGISCIRLSLGASDLNSFVFSYDDVPEGREDWTLAEFSLSQDLNDVVPVMKEILAVNPELFIISSPWSAPVWMKDSRNIRGGKLRHECYGVYADYFVKYIKAMASEGIHVDAVTVQNEPLNSRNTPSMPWDPQDQVEFIAEHLGPAIKAAGLDTDIILFDHNCDRIDYPLSILADPRVSRYVSGTGFHHYMGDMSAMTQMHMARPDKDIYFTEQMLIDRSFSKSGRIAQSVKRMVIDVTRAWSRNIILWNLASDKDAGPHTDNGGCPFCYGAVTIEDNHVERNLAYYTMAHISSFVPRGSVRIYSTDMYDPAIMMSVDEQHPEVYRANYYMKSSVLPNVAFSTPEGKTVLIISNTTSSDQMVEIQYKGKYASVFIKSGAVGSYIW